MKLNKLSLIVGALLISSGGFAQSYTFPISPGSQAFLSGTMGELRSTHFHGGIDIKTEGREGWPIYAISDGYVSRIKISTGGYGHALYVKHTDGNTSVYAHCQRFNDVIEKYVREAQYKAKSYTIELFPEANEFPVSQKEVIAWSGNTGGSSGPHLHFEIRDENQRPLNPLDFSFEEVKDQIPPTLVSLGIRPLNIGARVEGQYHRMQYDIRQKGRSFSLNKEVVVYGDVGVELYSFDRQNGSLNRNGYPDLELYLDGQLIWEQALDRFSFANGKGIYVHYNYPVSRTIGRRFAKMYQDDGNPLQFYGPSVNRGMIHITEGTHQMRVVARDAYGNESELHATLVGKKPSSLVSSDAPYSRDVGYRVDDNSLVYYVKHAAACETGTLYANRMEYDLEPAYQVDDYQVFLWDLRKGLPDSTQLCGVVDRYQLKMEVPNAGAFSFFDEHASYRFPARSLFDTAYLTSSYITKAELGLEVFSVGSRLVPLRRGFEIELKPQRIYNKERAAAYTVDGEGNFSFVGGEWTDQGTLKVGAGFGDYTIVEDSIPPSIKPYWANTEEFRFRIEDELSGIANYEAHLDGEWVLMFFEPKTHQVFSKKLDDSKPFRGELVITVTDNAGNESNYRTKID